MGAIIIRHQGESVKCSSVSAHPFFLFVIEMPKDYLGAWPPKQRPHFSAFPAANAVT